ncbi:LysR substrate-binding domain-containing protein [Altericroceibacterium spongiae]|uniref:LysR substrate-binding domain-containing protein n=1 Tax=Altericroceibacterium spongiae TaxID=2320269 RepID=UPI00160389B6|nr:LysR substrate-binding domain-containing protein [Altericroceibacterium spongiae]
MSNSRLFPPLAALRAFEAVGRLGGIRRAAKELGIDHAVVSRHIRSLENWLDTQMVIRNGSANQLTSEGEEYYKEIYSALTTISTATGKLLHSGNELSFSLWCIPGFAFLWLADHLGDFIASNPNVSVDFRPADNSPDFRTKEVHGDIRYLREWEEADVSRFARRFEFARPYVFPVASPACAAQLPPIQTAADLLDCPLLHENNDLEWLHWLRAQGLDIEDRMPGSRLWHAHLTLNAARQGHGIALANHMLLSDDLEKGRLVRITPRTGDFKPVNFGAYTFLAREDRWNAPVIVRFRKWLQSTMANEPA